MRKFRWDKVANDKIKRTFWERLSDDDLDQLEDTLFKLGIYDDIELAVGSVNSLPATTKQKDISEKESVVTILDHRKAQNISKIFRLIKVIFLGGIKSMTLDIWGKSIAQLNTDVISDNRAKMIYSFLPTLEEVIIK